MAERDMPDFFLGPPFAVGQLPHPVDNILVKIKFQADPFGVVQVKFAEGDGGVRNSILRFFVVLVPVRARSFRAMRSRSCAPLRCLR
jgi:hypothetical protein